MRATKQTKFRRNTAEASRSGSMNVGSDIAQLSYKELQTLALRYRIPRNIKKKVLVKVLQAARSGNDAEFYQLLHELRKTRKRKTRKSKNSKLGITSTPLHSPDYIMAEEDYYYQQQLQQPQQQSPYQWCFPVLQIGAEEEIVSKEDDTKIPHYEEFKRFLLKRFQREFQACDSNNNQVEDLNIVNLRTTPMSPNLEMIPVVEPSYPKMNLINDTDPLAISNDRSSYQVLKEEPEGGSQGSFLLKRMLQAPVGANLGEIASSLFWADNLLDNSDTLTAESESNENEDQQDTNTNKYYLLKNSKGEFMLNEANLMPQQVSSVLPTDNQYRFSGDMDTQPNSYQNWKITSVMEVPDRDLQSSKLQSFHTIYYNNTDSTVTVATADNNLSYQYQTETASNDGQNFFNSDAQDTNYTTGTDVTANEPSDIYYLQNFSKHNGEMSTGYFRNVDTVEQNNMLQTVYANDQQYQYLYPRFTQETNNLLNERFEQPQSNLVAEKIIENSINQETNTENLQRSANGTMETFWPKWSPEPNNNLENILNYHVAQQVDYSKLSQTACVYSYVAPIVSQQSNLAINDCTIERRHIAEQRQHSFSSYWMLYNDTSQGMRMTNTRDNLLEQSMSTHTTIMSNSDDLKETVNNAPINDVWMNQYEPSSIADDMDMQVSDSLFYNVAVDRINDIDDPGRAGYSENLKSTREIFKTIYK